MFDGDDRKLEAHKSTFLGDMTSSLEMNIFCSEHINYVLPLMIHDI